MKKIITTLLFAMSSLYIFSQELFVLTEPASNMATRSVGFRLTGTMMQEPSNNSTSLHVFPEAMIGVTKNIMFHTEGFFSNRNNTMKLEGGSLYMKYRFYSIDEVHSHFRMAAFTRLATNNSDIHQEAIDLNGHNSGYEVGVVFTKLINKVAVSSSHALVHAEDNGSKNKFIEANAGRDAYNFTLSVGKLMLPKEYENYNQPNLNLMLEMLGQTNLKNGKTYLDAAPLVQLILKSRMRIDFGYRYAVSNVLTRTSPNGFLLRFEYNIFSAF